MRMSIPMCSTTFVDSFNGLLGWYKCDYLRTIAITKFKKKMYQKSSFAAWWINPNHSNGANLYIQISAIAYFDMDYWIFAILRKWWALNQINIIYNTLFVWKFSCSTFCSDLSLSERKTEYGNIDVTKSHISAVHHHFSLPECLAERNNEIALFLF